MTTATKTRKPSPQEVLIANQLYAIKEYANHQIEKGGRHADGWDIVIEAWSDEDILTAIGKARTTAGAVNKMASVVRLLADHRNDIRSA